MDAARSLHLLAAGDLAVWPDLSRDLERRADAPSAAEALRSLHAQGHAVEAAQWLAHVTDTDTLQTLRAALLAHAEGWPVSSLRALTLDLLSATFRLIPAGSFRMGSPDDEEGREDDEAAHPVTLTQPFLLKATPVTQGEWRALMGDNPAHFQGDDRRPVEQVSWHDAARACNALSTQTGGLYRLPTEAEWEYACRAGTTGPRYADLDLIAWFEDTSGETTQPVCQKRPNPWGLYDMLGNVFEWCQDGYDLYPATPQRDPCGPPTDGQRIVRGGAWYSSAHHCRAASRLYEEALHADMACGIRPAVSL